MCLVLGTQQVYLCVVRELSVCRVGVSRRAGPFPMLCLQSGLLEGRINRLESGHDIVLGFGGPCSLRPQRISVVEKTFKGLALLLSLGSPIGFEC